MASQQANSSTGRASVSKTEGWGFDSLLACQQITDPATFTMTMADTIKLVVAGLLGVAGIVGFYLLGEAAFIVKLLAVVAGIIAGCAVAWTTAPGGQFVAFALDSVTETKKVVWPTRKDTMQTTAAVFAFVVVMAVFLWVSDKTLEWVLYDLVLGWKKT
jgi:preprotein translocase subunit SecE